MDNDDYDDDDDDDTHLDREEVELKGLRVWQLTWIAQWQNAEP